MDELTCKYCNRICKNSNSHRNHERLCKSNPNRQKTVLEDKEWRAKNIKPEHLKENQYTKAKRLGIDPPILSKETRYKLGSGLRGKKLTQETKDKISAGMKRAVKENPDSYSKNNVSGRVKHVDYKGVRLKGSWEVKVAKWLDSQNIQWESEARPQEYIFENSTKTYFPDFYLKDFEIFIEVKGYKTEKDEAKWEQFPFELLIIDGSNINKLEKLKLKDIKPYERLRQNKKRL